MEIPDWWLYSGALPKNLVAIEVICCSTGSG
jgi:hypothetical protein